MRYFIYGYYGFGNFGDDLMLAALVDQIRRRDGAAQFTVKCNAAVAGLGPGVSFLAVEPIMAAPGSRWRRGLRYLRALFAGLRGHDHLVIGGGALFLDKGRASAALFLLWCLVVRARLAGMRIAIVGVSCDLIAHPLSLILARGIFRCADTITVRDIFSHDYARYFGRGDARLCADLSFAAPAFRDARPGPRRSPGAKARIGICLVDYYAEYEPDAARRGRFLDGMAASLERHAGAAEYVYLSLQENAGLGDSRVYAELARRADFAGYRAIGSVDDLGAAVADLDAVLTMRYHLGLLAAAWGLRVGVIYHELKMLAVGLVPGVAVTTCRQILDDAADPVAGLVRGGDRMPDRPDCAALAADAAANFFWLPPP